MVSVYARLPLAIFIKCITYAFIFQTSTDLKKADVNRDTSICILLPIYLHELFNEIYLKKEADGLDWNVPVIGA